jgi:DNA polymerase-3 subunit delta'
MKVSCIPFSQIVGQERAIRFLRQAMASGKMPHAYLFVGIPGIGKATAALALCQALNCERPFNGEGCGHCISCRKMISGNFPDLVILEPEGQNIKIEQVRSLDRMFGFKPAAGKYRVSLLRQAETMTEEAANAFLKSLEEPPPGNIMIMTVTEPLDLLPTILSRCQRVTFRPIPVPLIEAWLMEKEGMEKGKASLLARVAEGSLGKALEMGKNHFLEKRQDLLSDLNRIMTMPPEEAVVWAVEYSTKAKKEKQESALPLLLSVWKTWYRDLILSKVNCSEDAFINVDFSRELKNASGNSRIQNLLESFYTLDQAERDLLRFRNLDLLMENVVLKLKRIYGRGRKERERRPARKPEQSRERSAPKVRQSPDL